MHKRLDLKANIKNKQTNKRHKKTRTDTTTIITQRKKTSMQKNRETKNANLCPSSFTSSACCLKLAMLTKKNVPAVVIAVSSLTACFTLNSLLAAVPQKVFRAGHIHRDPYSDTRAPSETLSPNENYSATSLVICHHVLTARFGGDFRRCVSLPVAHALCL